MPAGSIRGSRVRYAGYGRGRCLTCAAPGYYRQCRSVTTSTVVKAPLVCPWLVKWRYTKYPALPLPFIEKIRKQKLYPRTTLHADENPRVTHTAPHLGRWRVNRDVKRAVYNISIVCVITRRHGDVLTPSNEYLLHRWQAVLLPVAPVTWYIASISLPTSAICPLHKSD